MSELFLNNYFIIFIHLCVWHMCGGQSKTLEMVLSFDHVDPRE